MDRRDFIKFGAATSAMATVGLPSYSSSVILDHGPLYKWGRMKLGKGFHEPEAIEFLMERLDTLGFLEETRVVNSEKSFGKYVDVYFKDSPGREDTVKEMLGAVSDSVTGGNTPYPDFNDMEIV